MDLSASNAGADKGKEEAVAAMHATPLNAEARAALAARERRRQTMRTLLEAEAEELPPTIPFDTITPEVQEYDGDDIDDILSDPGQIDDEEQDYEGDEQEQGEPDLRTYFSQWDLAPGDQIALCRTYANHLSAAMRPKTRGPYKKRLRVTSAEKDVPDAPVAPQKRAARGWRNLNKPYIAPRRF